MPWSDLPESYHVSHVFALYSLGRLGHEAVIVFFLLSGFLVGGRGLEKIHQGSFNVASYSVDRFSRIFPPLAMAIVFYFVTCLILGNDFNYLCAVGNLFCLQGVCCEPLLAPFWSLSYEVWFYIALAGIGLIFSKRIKNKVLGFLLTVVVSGIFMSGLSFHYLALWLIGAAAYLTKPSRRNNFALVFAIIGTFVGIILWQMSAYPTTMSLPFKIENTKLIELFLAMMVGILIQQLILIEPKRKLPRFIERKLGYLAKFSYTMYLSHKTVLMLLFAFVFDKGVGIPGFRGMIQYIALLLITLAFCWCIYLVSERYTPQIKRLIIAKLNIESVQRI